MRYLTFTFLREDRVALLAALDALPDVRLAGPAHVVSAGSGTCAVELDFESGTVALEPGAGDAAAALATEALVAAGAMFAGCC